MAKQKKSKRYFSKAEKTCAKFRTFHVVKIFPFLLITMAINLPKY